MLVLDMMMPELDGLTVCRRLRLRRVPHSRSSMLTARTEVADRVPGLDAGADDYLPKPFALDELLARAARAAAPDAARRRRGAAALAVADLALDPAARRAWRGEREIELTKTEFDLLELLVRNAGIVLDARDDLRPHLGLRLRTRLQGPRRLHRVPAPQDRGGRRAPPDPHRARRGLHVAVS